MNLKRMVIMDVDNEAACRTVKIYLMANVIRKSYNVKVE
jgi:hypothetical protein